MCTEFLLQLCMRVSLPPPPPSPTFPFPFYTDFVLVVWVESKKTEKCKKLTPTSKSMTLYLMYKTGTMVILCTLFCCMDREVRNKTG